MNLLVSALGPVGFGVYELNANFELIPSAGVPKVILAPGFIDIHIHGGHGVDFMSSSTEESARLCKKLAESGYEGLVPTTVTASLGDVSAAFARLPENDMILGFHLEGPFISPDYPGAQPKEWIIPPPPTDSPWEEILSHPKLKVITVAPELPGALELIARMQKQGICVGMGHTSATYSQALAGFSAGASHTTHTYNAMRGFHHREAGIAGFALIENGLACELIYDRLHVSHEAARVLIAAKPADKLIAVSDGTAAAGLPTGTKLSMWHHDAIVGNGDVRLPDGTLAGSAINLLDAFQNLAEDFGPELAIRATSLNPRKLLSIQKPSSTWLIFNHRFELLEIRRR